MATSGIPSNPFAGLLTPDVLKSRRRAEMNDTYADQNFWVAEAAGYGRKIDEIAKANGLNLGPEDIKALETQQILQNANKAAAKAVQEDGMSVEEAQAMAVENTLEAFMAAGNYEAAAALAPSVWAVRQKREDIAKLKAQQFKEIAAGSKDMATAQQTRALTPGKVTSEDAKARSLDALTMQRMSAAGASDAEARLRDRTDPNIRAAGKGGKSAAGDAGEDAPLTPTDRSSYRNRATATMSAVRSIGQLYKLYDTRTGPVGTASGAWAAGVLDELNGVMTSAVQGSATESERKADQEVISRNLDEGGTFFKSKEARRLSQAAKATFNVDYGQWKSMTIDLAYRLAKARDGNGRLSDADVKNAMDILGASGDPKRAKAVMLRVGRDMLRDIQSDRNSHSELRSMSVNEELDKAQEDFNGLLRGYKGQKLPDFGTKPAAEKSNPKVRTVKGVTYDEVAPGKWKARTK